jgi:hypothetical protein
MMGDGRARRALITEWARLIQGNAANGALLGEPVGLRISAICGPRAAALEILAGIQAGSLLDLMNKSDMALMRQLVPWEFVGRPAAFMRGRYVRLEAGWPKGVGETMIRLSDLSGDFQEMAARGAWLVGRDERGRSITTSLKDRTAHFLMAGATGSGKSTAIRGALVALSASESNRIVLIDGKLGESLGPFRDMRGRVGPLVLDLESARGALAWVYAEMRDRYRRRGLGDPLDDRIVVIFDEFQYWANDAAVAAYMAQIAAQGRAANVHLIAATQHPTVSTFGDPSTPREIAGRMALYVTDADASRVVVGGAEPRADRLLGAGDCYLLAPGVCHRLQVAYVDEADFAELPQGMPELETWPAYRSDEGPDTGALKPITAQEAALAVRTALAPPWRGRARGRGYLSTLMAEAGLESAGTGRMNRILTFGRDLAERLQSAPDVCISGAEETEHEQA